MYKLISKFRGHNDLISPSWDVYVKKRVKVNITGFFMVHPYKPLCLEVLARAGDLVAFVTRVTEAENSKGSAKIFFHIFIIFLASCASFLELIIISAVVGTACAV